MPLGRVHWTRDEKGKNLLQNEIINEIAKNHQVSPAQVLLRVGFRNRQSYQIIEYMQFHFFEPEPCFQIQRGVLVIPKSQNLDRIESNGKLFHFFLTEKEMTDIKALNRDQRSRNFSSRVKSK